MKDNINWGNSFTQAMSVCAVQRNARVPKIGKRLLVKTQDQYCCTYLNDQTQKGRTRTRIGYLRLSVEVKNL